MNTLIEPTFLTSHFLCRILLKIRSKCSFIKYKLCFFADFCLILHQKFTWCEKPVENQTHVVSELFQTLYTKRAISRPIYHECIEHCQYRFSQIEGTAFRSPIELLQSS